MSKINFSDLENNYVRLISTQEVDVKLHPFSFITADGNKIKRDIISISISNELGYVSYCFFLDTKEAFVIDNNGTSDLFPLELQRDEKLYPQFFLWDKLYCYGFEMRIELLYALYEYEKKLINAHDATAIAS